MSKASKVYSYLNHRIRVTIQDNRTLVGTFLAFDRHMNMVLSDVEEHRRVISRTDGAEQLLKRALGMMILRGESIVSMTIEGPAPVHESRLRVGQSAGLQENKGAVKVIGVGRGNPVAIAAPIQAGRGMPVAIAPLPVPAAVPTMGTLPAGLPAGLPPGLPPMGLLPGLPVGLPPGLPPGLPVGMGRGAPPPPPPRK
eukprot:ANDGO_04476.mRNA.1 Small nuclear ribonucleoprotein-associated protein B